MGTINSDSKPDWLDRVESKDREICRRWLEDNPGDRWEFVHCGRVWRTSEKCPPCVICPECGEAMLGRGFIKGLNERNVL